MIIVSSPRPPLNLFNTDRIVVPSFYTTILDVPQYRIPVNGPSPERFVSAVALLTSLIVANNSNDDIQVSLQILNAQDIPWLILNKMTVPPNDFALIDLAKQNLISGERLQIRTENFQGAIASLSYVLNQREEFTVIP